MKIKLLLLSLVTLVFFSYPSLAEEFYDLDPSALSGYYIADEYSFLILGDGSIVDISDLSSNSSEKTSAISAYSDDFSIIIISENHPICLTPLEEKEKTDTGGSYYALYSNYIGNVNETEFHEGSEIIFEDYIFGNDYIVTLREPLSTFFSIDVSSNTSLSLEGNGYESPEEAVTAYLDAFQQGDIYKMLSTFAVETFVENYSVEKQIERMRSYSPKQYIPAVSEYAQHLNLEIRRSRITDYIRRQYLTLTNSKTVDDTTFLWDESMSISDFVADIFAMDDSDIFASFEFDNVFYNPEELYDNFNSENNLRVRNILQGVYGCDDLKSVVAEFSVNNIPYILCMDVGCYGKSWYNVEFIGNIGSILGLSYINGGISMTSEVFS